MADSLKVLESTSPSAVEVDMDEIGGKKVPRVKVGIGPDGSFSETSNSNPYPVTEKPSATEGLTPIMDITCNATGELLKGSAGKIYTLIASNTNAAFRYLKLYDKATAPTVGTDTPKQTIPLPPNSTTPITFPGGLAFTLGIGYGATTGVAAADTGAPGTNDVVINGGYK